MNTKRTILTGLITTLLATAASAQAPNLVSYQGRVVVGTVNFEGTGQFRFALVNAAGTTVHWSNAADTTPADGVPDAAVALPVSKGLYSVLLGDATIANMAAIPASTWATADVRLRVWFNDGVNGNQLLTPDQRIAPAGYLADGSVNTAQLATSAVTTAKLNDGAVTTTKLNDGSITASKINGQAIGTAQIAGAAITGPKLADGSVSSAKLTSGAVQNANIAAGAVDTAQIADNAITSAKINSGAVDSTKIANNAVTTVHIGNNAVTAAHIAADAVTSAQIATGVVTGPKLANGAVSTDKLNNNSVTAAKLGADVGFWAVSGANAFRSVGNVGIGTATPESLFHVGNYASAGIDSFLTISTSGAGGTDPAADRRSGIALKNFSNSYGFTISSLDAGNYGGLEFRRHFSDPVGIPTMFLDRQSGNVGIGTGIPTSPLQIGDYGSLGDNYVTVATQGGNLQKAGIKLRHFNDSFGFTIESDDRFGSIGLNFLDHFNDANGLSRLFIERGTGKIGIGTTSPSAPLQIMAGAGSAPDTNGLDVFNPNNTADSHAILSARVAGSDAGNPVVSLNVVGESGWNGWNIGLDNADANKFHIASTSVFGGSPRMTITTDGNVGLGTTLPSEKLHVTGNTYLQVPASSSQIRALSIDVASFGTGENASDSYFLRAQDIGAGSTPFVVRGDGKVGIGTAYPGSKLTVEGEVNGLAQNEYNAYPVVVYGGSHGIVIDVAGGGENGSPNHSNNYLFMTAGGYIRGSIQGQDSADLYGSFDYIWFQTMSSLQNAFSIAIIAAEIVQVDLGEAGVHGVEFALILGQWAQQTAEMEGNIGVVFQSNAGDYAEWLEKKNPAEDIRAAEIVGMSGGKVSKSTAGADKCMIVSTAPIVAGNMQSKEDEKRFKKIAFVGQVPVKVRGAVRVGDYVLASGLHDGYGIGVRPERMTLPDYKNIAGVAWSALPEGIAEGLVNVAVGINTNDLTSKLIEQQKQIDGIISYLKAKDPAFPGVAGTATAASRPAPAVVTPLNPVTTAGSAAVTPARPAAAPDWAKMKQSIKDHPELFVRLLQDAKDQLAAKGTDISKNPRLAQALDAKFYTAWVNSPAPTLVAPKSPTTAAPAAGAK